jgi:hypothetical protein
MWYNNGIMLIVAYILIGVVALIALTLIAAECYLDHLVRKEILNNIRAKKRVIKL